MHDRAARPAGAVKSAAAIVIEIMILVSIDLRIAQVRPRVEEKRSAPFGLTIPSCLFSFAFLEAFCEEEGYDLVS